MGTMGIDVGNENQKRRRINKIKKIIICLVIVAIIVPTVLSSMLAVKVVMLEKEIVKLESEVKRLEEASVKTVTSVNEPIADSKPADIVLNETEEATVQVYYESDDVDKMAENAETVADNYDGLRKVYLTFDDGPSESTDKILDILAEYNVKATFFVLAKNDTESIRRYNRIVDEGHTLAMHSYTHAYNQIYADIESFKKDVTDLQNFLTEATGVKPVVYRFPGGSSNTVMNVDVYECIDFLDEQGIIYFDWNVSSGDATGDKHPVNVIVDNVINGSVKHDESIVLMHDAKSKEATVSALPIIIESFLEMDDVVMLPLTEDSYPIQHTKK